MKTPRSNPFLSALETAGNRLASLAKGNRTLTYATLLATALGSANCSSEDEATPEVQPDRPTRGITCVRVLDQNNGPMPGCKFSYEIDEKILDEDETYYEKWGSGRTPENPCSTEDTEDGGVKELFAYGRPGEFKVAAQCGDLYGMVSVDINKVRYNDEKDAGADAETDADITEEPTYELQTSHLEGSLCTNNEPAIVIHEKGLEDYRNKQVYLADYMGYMGEDKCDSWDVQAGKIDAEKKTNNEDASSSTVAKITLDCPADATDCDPEDGWFYAEVADERKVVIREGKYQHLLIDCHTDQVPAGETRTVIVKIFNEGEHEQYTNFPIEIRGPKATDTETAGN